MSVQNDGFGVEGRITRRTYDSSEIRTEIPFWDDYDELCEVLGETFEDNPNPLNAARLQALDELVEEVSEERTKNIILDDFLTFIVDMIDSTQSPSIIEVSHLAIGDDGSAVSSADTGLGNEVYRTSIDSITDNGKDLTTETLIGSGEANGNTFREVGVVSSSSGGTFFNHALVSDEAKTSDKSITYQVELQMRVA